MYKKFASLQFTTGLVLLACLAAALEPASVAGSSCTNVTTRFLGIPATNCVIPPLALQMTNPISVVVEDGFPNSYLKATLSNVPAGYSISNAVYADWCVDYHGPIPEPGPQFHPILYPSTGPLPAHLAHTNWNKINYILNHKQGGYTNIQSAIWHFIGGPIPAGDPVFAPATRTATTSNLIAAAEAYGADFMPGPGEVTAVILDLGANLQVNIIEVVCIGPIEICIGGQLTICTTNSGTAPLSVSWSKNGVVIPGATGDCLTLSNLTAADSGAYCIRVSNACSAVTNCLQLNVTNTLDNTPPVIVCASNRTYQCLEQVPPAPDLGVVTATDNSGRPPTVEFTGQTITTNGCEIRIVRTYKATDSCNNISVCTHTMTVRDTILPVLTCPADLIVPNVASIPSCAGSLAQFRALGGVASDNCDTNLAYQCTDGPLVGGVCGGLIMRTHTVTDRCANSASCIQIINVATNTPPTLTCPPNIQVQCPTDVPPCAGSLAQFVAMGGSFTGSNLLYSCSDSPLIGQGCGGVITRTHSVIDVCTNITRCVQTITIRDTLPPTIVCGQNLTVECGTQWTFDLPTAHDNCSGTNVSIVLVSTVTNKLCGNTFAAIRTWRAADACTNTAMCSQTVTIVDTLPPVLACGIDLTIECGTSWAFTPPTAVDACDGTAPVISILSTVTNALCGNTYRVVRTYKATDACTNMSTNSQIITLVDTTPPALVCGSARTVECGTAWTFDRPTANDACDGTNVTVRIVSTVTNALCGNTFRATRTWEAVDQCTNLSRCSQVVTVVDTTPPVLVGVPGNETYQCLSDVPTPPSVTATDLCDGANVQVSAVSGIGIDGCAFVISQSWTAVDQCSNSVTRSRTITVRDTMAPQLVCGGNRAAECGTPWTFDMPEVKDNCDPNPTLRVLSTVTNALCGRTFSATRTWEALDACTNRSTCSQTIAIIDTLPPVLACGIDLTIECGTSWAFTPPTAVDACDGTTPVISILSTVTNALCGNTYRVVRTYKATDACTNMSTNSQIITLVDTTPPALLCGSARTVECGTAWTFDRPPANDACDGTNVTVRIVSTVTNALCGNTFRATRTWEAVDQCTNVSRCSQVVTVVDTTPPVLVGVPGNETYQCLTDVPTPPSVTATDLCDGANVQVSAVSGIGINGCAFLISQSWTAVDQCSNSVTRSRTITVRDTMAPQLVCGGNRMAECGTPWTFDMPEVKDNCDPNPTLRVLSTVTNALCGRTFSATRTWEALDTCTNRSTCSQTITVVDSTPPSLTCGKNQTVECGTTWMFAMPAATDLCDGTNVMVRIVSTITNALCGQTFTATRTWEAIDQCTNSARCSQTIAVVDSTPPSLSCWPNQVVECGTPWNFPTPLAFDLCDGTNLNLTVVSTVTNVTCGKNFAVTRTWKVADLCTNSALCSQTITLVDTTPPVLVCAPALTAECGAAWNFTTPTAFDGCDGAGLAVRIVSTTTNALCGKTFSALRTWETVDLCNNTSRCSQAATVLDTQPPILAGSTNFSIQCGTPWSFTTPTATDLCDGAGVPVTIISTTTNNTCGRTFIATRTYKATDACGNMATNSQTVTVIDTLPPVLVNVPSNTSYECLINVPPMAAAAVTATDNCDANVTITATAVTNGVCPAVIVRTWKATDSCSNTASASQIITVIERPPFIVSAPRDARVCPGGMTNFCVVATNACPLTYQWLRGANVLIGQTNACLSLAGITAQDQGQYCVVVSSPCFSTTACANLTLLTNVPPPALPPIGCLVFGTNLMICPQVSAPEGLYSCVWSKIVGNTTNLITTVSNCCLVLTNYNTANAGRYQLQIVGPCNTTSALLELPAPVLVCQPVPCPPLTRCVGTSAEFCNTNFTALPGVAYTFQWFKVDNNTTNLILNATNQCLVLSNIIPSDAGSYLVAVTATSGGVSLRTDFCGGLLNVLTRLTQHALTNATVCVGASAQFCTEAAGDINNPATYQWYRNGQLLLNQTNACILIANVSADMAGPYCVVVTGSCNSVTNCGMLTIQGAVGDFVWEDLNFNGRQDMGEPGISNITVQLLDCATSNVLQTTATDTNGLYLFTCVSPGNYFVRFVPLPGWFFTLPNMGSDDRDSDANRTDGLTGCFTITGGETNRTVDAGLIRPAALGDFVWEDRNTNGLQDVGEPGISNVVVQLQDCEGDTIANTQTDADGRYLFVNLVPGSYKVMFVRPDGTVFTTSNALPDDRDSDATLPLGMTACYVLTSGQTNLTVDAGLVKLGAIGDFVWLDSNKNGLQDIGENGVTNVTVKLMNCLNVVLAMTNTDASGSYLFTGLLPGNYNVMFNLPAGYEFTAANQGGNDAKDSDANPADGMTGCYNLVSGQTNRTVDAGLTLGLPCLNLVKTAAKLTVGVYEPITYTYVATNCGSVALTNVVVTDDNGTPSYAGDDFTVGTVPVLLPGSTATLTHTVRLPVQLCDATTMVPSGEIIIVDVTSNGNFLCTFIQSFGVNDNTYGTNSDIGWTQIGKTHKFGDLTGSDQATWSFRNGAGTEVLAFEEDYISASAAFPSGYGTLGLGGDGGMIAGNPAYLLGFNTSLTDNLNKPPFLSNLAKYTVNSPASNDVNSAQWEYRMIYQVLVDKAAFGPSGFGRAIITAQHNSPGKKSVTPVFCGWCVTNIATAVTVSGTNQLRATDDARVCVVTGPLGALGDYVWRDSNNNGRQDAGEPGVADVEVRLQDCQGGTFYSTTTDANGRYLFGGLPAGDYRVQFVAPAGATFTTRDAAGVADTLDSDADPVTGLSACITLGSGQTNLTIDAGFSAGPPPPPGLCLMKTAAKPVVGVFEPITYTYVVTNCGTLSLTNVVVTDDNGTPSYTGDDFIVGTVPVLLPGSTATLTHTVRLPVQLCDATTMVPSGEIIIVDVTSNGNFLATFIQSFAVNDNTYGVNSDIGWTQIGKTHKFGDLTGSDQATWSFRNGAGTQVLAFEEDYISASAAYPSGYGTLGLGGDGGMISGNPAYLLGFNTSLTDNLNKPPFLGNLAQYTVNSPASNDVNSAQWEYRMIYQVLVDKAAFGPSGFGSAIITSQHNSPGKRSVTPVFCDWCVTNIATAVAVSGGSQLFATDDARVCVVTGPLGALGDYVWLDSNGNGRQDAGEPGVPDVEVRLLDCQGGTFFSTTTDTNGRYLFGGLPAGSYRVQFVAPAGASFTTRDAAGVTDSLDSDADPVTGLSACIALASGQTNLTVDAGLSAGPPEPPGLCLLKTAARPTVGVFEPITYTYVVTNCGTLSLTNVVVTDDNGTPTYPGDDFTVGTVPVLLPGSTATLTHTVRLPVQLCDATTMVPSGEIIIVDVTSNGNFLATFIQSFAVNDNTYGTNSDIGWTQIGKTHKFGDLTGSDQATWSFRNGAGTEVLAFEEDYISASAAFPSGYGTLGLGGDGGMISGNPAFLLGFNTSLTDNLNKQPFLGNLAKYTVNSPASNDVNSAQWEYRMIYQVLVDKAAFGPSGFGRAIITSQHNSPGKRSVTPVFCDQCVTNTATAVAVSSGKQLLATDDARVCVVTGPLGGLGDYVWMDTNANGRQDAGEPGVADVEVRLQDCQGGTYFSTTTDANGHYLLGGLPAGNYRIQFVAPAGATFTTRDAAGVADTSDSDVEPSTGLTACLTVASGQTNLTVGAGLMPPAMLPVVIRHSGENCLLEWPQINNATFVLESTISLQKPITWSVIATNPPHPYVIIAPQNGVKFYRIRMR